MRAFRVASKRPVRRANRLWVVGASLALTVFTVFVLLDTFAIARVDQAMQEADLSSIVSTQGNTAFAAEGDDGADASGTSQAADSASSSSTSANSSSASSTGRHGPGSHGGGPAGHGGPGKSRSSDSSATKSASSSSSASKAGVAGSAVASNGTEIGSYSDDNMKITVSSVRAYDTDIYVADIQVSSAEYLKTALAQNAYGRNLKDTTSNMANAAGAVLAINGDYYGFRDDGYVVRNGVLYRDTASSGTDALVVYGDGTMDAVSQDTSSAQSIADAGAWQVLSFGPVLVDDGQVVVGENAEVSQSMGSNPRTAIGMISPLHYIVVVSDGRTGESQGLSLQQLAQVFADNGATFAYNLDGGGSTTLYFKGEVINNPTSGNRDGERSVSDIVYFG